MILKARDVLSEGAFVIAKNGGGDPENNTISFLRYNRETKTFSFLGGDDEVAAAFTSLGDVARVLNLSRDRLDALIRLAEFKRIPVSPELEAKIGAIHQFEYV
ncbi:hypothetical protein C4553_03350 [Candidatus Parcubacteria bacterium]|nr:MAG: hypothetical protein C4553_03350 [Candidatus Parcubacteria bacterium]